MDRGSWIVEKDQSRFRRLFSIIHQPSTIIIFALFSLSSALASDADDVLSALKQARSLSARGEVQVTVLFPPRDVPTRLVKKLPVLAVRPALIAKNFDVLKAGAQTLAGRAVTRYDLTPKSGSAARWRLWVDAGWNVPLGFEERGADGSLVRQALFQKVNAEPAKEKQSVPAVPAGLRKAVLTALPGFQFPPGFTPIRATAKEKRTEITLSDGLNILALVIAPHNVRAAPGVASRRVGGQFVWLVGNLPPADLNAALLNVRPGDAAALGTFLTPPDSNP